MMLTVWLELVPGVSSSSPSGRFCSSATSTRCDPSHDPRLLLLDDEKVFPTPHHDRVSHATPSADESQRTCSHLTTRSLQNQSLRCITKSPDIKFMLAPLSSKNNFLHTLLSTVPVKVSNGTTCGHSK